MGAKAASEPWVGRSLPRLEDEALLRGEGRFIDDLDPVANARHAAVLRSPFAHARITRLDASGALELPGVVGVLTGADVAELSRPFPAGIDSPIPHYAAAHELARYVGEPVAVVVARDRYLAEDALELIEVEYEPLDPVLDAEAAARTGACVSDRSFHYGDVDGALAGADLVVRERFRFPRWSCTPVECYGVVADWNAAEGSLTAWANFQGPFTLHSVAAAALGLPGSKLRLITPPDSGGSFGIKSAVFASVVLMGLASRKLGVPVRWIEDRLEHLAASSSSSGRVTRRRGRVQVRRRARRAPLRRDRGRRCIRPRARAGDALPHARVALRRVPGSTRGRPEPRRPHEHDAERAQPRVRRAAALPRARADDDDRGERGSGSIRPSSGVATWSRRTRSRTGRRRGRCTTPATTRAASTTRSSSRATTSVARKPRPRATGDVSSESGSPASSSPPSRTWATSRSPSRPATRGLPKSGNAEGCTIVVSALGGITVRTATTPQGQGHRTVIAQVVADALGVDPTDVDVVTEVDTSTTPWTIASGNYSSRFSGVGVGAVAAAAERLAAKIAAIRDHLGDESASLRRVAGTAHWNPESLPPEMEPGLAVTAYYAAPNLLPPDAEDQVASSASHGFVADVAVVEIDPETGEVAVLDYVTVHDAGRLLNPLLAEGQVRGGLAHGAASALFERHVYDEDGNLLTGSFMDYLVPTAPDLPTPRIGHRESPSPFLPLGAKGLGEGTTMSVPGRRWRTPSPTRSDVDDVEPPFTPGRVWELLRR